MNGPFNQNFLLLALAHSLILISRYKDVCFQHQRLTLNQANGKSCLFIPYVLLQCTRMQFLSKLHFEIWSSPMWNCSESSGRRGTLQLPIQMVVKYQVVLIPINCHFSKTLRWLSCNLVLPCLPPFPSFPSSPKRNYSSTSRFKIKHPDFLNSNIGVLNKN